jgi:hypothetical protein
MADLAAALMNQPIPGQSLTRSPDARAPYESPPAVTELAGVTQILFNAMTSDSFLQAFMDAANQGNGIVLDKIAAITLHEAFSSGKITPDLAILAVEPCIEVLMFISSLLDIPVKFASDDKETDWQGVMRVASKQAKNVGASSPATLQEWLAQNDVEEQPEEPVTKAAVKKAVSLLAPPSSPKSLMGGAE